MFKSLIYKTKQTIAIVAAVATIATTGLLYATDDAHADRRDFWGGVAAGAITGVIIGSAVRSHRYERRVYHDRPVYYERRVYHRPHYRKRYYRKRYYRVKRHHHHHSHYHRSSDAHVNWCYNRYRSYDARSDTFQPYHGPRRYCNSPYN